MMIVVIVLFILFIRWIIKMIDDDVLNRPTWKGIILSSLFGLLPLYLILCFFGVMGEEKDNEMN